MTFISTNAGGLWQKVRKIVPLSSSIDADKIALQSFKGVRYILHIKNESQDVYKTMEMLSTRVGGSDVEDNVFANLGDNIAIQANVIVQGSDVILRLINSETFPLTVSISKLITS